MNDVHVLFWFDVEDCTVTHSDDAAKRLAVMLGEHGVTGTFKIVGQKARILEQRVRYDVLDALAKHHIGYHSNWHGLRPQVAEYLAPLSWDAGAAAFQCRERQGVDDIRRIVGAHPVTYGQPGANWAPQVFPVLRAWQIPTYVSGFGYVGLDCQPFWYGGVLCTSHMYGKRLDGQEQRHLIGLNFELGRPGELERHQNAFSRSLGQLERTGGLISIANHPCTLVLEEWFSTAMKSRDETEAGHRHFDDFVAWTRTLANVKFTAAGELCTLYPDRSCGRALTRDELRAVAVGLADEVNFVRLGDVAVSAAEGFGLLARTLRACLEESAVPAGVLCTPAQNPRQRPNVAGAGRDATVPWDAFRQSVSGVAAYMASQREVPDVVRVGDHAVPPEDFLGALARAVVTVLDGQPVPDEVTFRPMVCRFEDYVDEAAAAAGWRGAMFQDGFAAPGLLELARLGAWTLKPAIMATG